MAKQIESPYFHYQLASRGKVFFTNLADGLITALLTFFLFIAVAYPVVSALPSSKTGYEATQSFVTKSNECLIPTRLVERKEDEDGFKSEEEQSRDYVYTLVRTSYFIRNKVSPMDNKNIPEKEKTFCSEDPYRNDPLGYYFFEFKKNTPSLNSYIYDGADISNQKEEWFYQTAFGYSSLLDDFEGQSDSLSLYKQLKPVIADALMDYWAYGESASASGATIYRELQSHYSDALHRFQAEIEANYPPYMSLVKQTESAYWDLMRNTLSGLLLAYVVAFALAEWVFPLFFKNHRTIAVKMMRVGYCRLDGGTMNARNAIIKGIIRFLLHFSGIALSLAFANLWVLFIYDFGGFALYPFFFLSLALDLVSLVLMLVTKRHQGLAELFAGICMKDLNRKEAPLPLESDEASPL